MLAVSNRAGLDGSSPLTRGKRAVGAPVCDRRGLIPAHAGKTSPLTDRQTPKPGSSPLTRGKRGAVASSCGASRLIPAHAGKTSIMRRAASRQRAHPRSRGENCGLAVRDLRQCGSSPLTRGKPITSQEALDAIRLIPAHAGKTAQDVIRLSRHTAHPRSRGENAPGIASVNCRQGSSPLTRGKPTRLMAGAAPPRLIPAHAGKTSKSSASGSAPQAHPRSRGENQVAGDVILTVHGSSPLTRGKRRSGTRTPRLTGLIPAHAGKTRFLGEPGRACWAHPRSRGENR